MASASAASAIGPFPAVLAVAVRSGVAGPVVFVLVVFVLVVHEVVLWWLGAHGATPFLCDRGMDLSFML